MLLLDILVFIPLGLFMIVLPEKTYKACVYLKLRNRDEIPTQNYYKTIRKIGVGVLVLGLLCLVLALVFGL